MQAYVKSSLLKHENGIFCSHTLYVGYGNEVFSVVSPGCFGLRCEYRQTVGKLRGVAFDALRHDELGYLTENRSALSAARSRQAILDDTDNATILRRFRREVAAEADHVPPCSAVITFFATGYLGFESLMRLADKPTALYCPESNRDIQATVECLCALGAEIQEDGGVYTVCPISREHEEAACLDCHESGSTLRFLLPLVAALGRSAYLHTSGRLTQRPLSPLYEELVRHGVKLSPQGESPLSVEGQLEGGVYRLDGGISSQFFTGLLLSLPLLSKGSTVEVEGVLESAPYVALTCDVMKKFGVEPLVTSEKMQISPAAFRSPGNLEIEGDWSNAAFWLTAGVLGGEIRLTGLQKNSSASPTFYRWVFI